MNTDEQDIEKKITRIGQFHKSDEELQREIQAADELGQKDSNPPPLSSLIWERILASYSESLPKEKVFTSSDENAHDFTTGVLPDFISYLKPFQSYQKEFCDSSEDGTYTTIGFLVWTRNGLEHKRIVVDIHIYLNMHQDGTRIISGKVDVSRFQRIAAESEKRFEWQTAGMKIQPKKRPEVDSQTGEFTVIFKTGEDNGNLAAWFIIDT